MLSTPERVGVTRGVHSGMRISVRSSAGIERCPSEAVLIDPERGRLDIKLEIKKGSLDLSACSSVG
jgi:hypothetical protein